MLNFIFERIVSPIFFQILHFMQILPQFGPARLWQTLVSRSPYFVENLEQISCLSTHMANHLLILILD